MEQESLIDKDRKFMAEQVRIRMKMLKVIHLALIAGVVGFGAFVLFYTRKQFSYELTVKNPVIIAAVLVSFGTMVTSFLLRKPRAADPRTHHDIHDILSKYQVFFLIRASIIESGALFAGVAILLTCNIVPVVVFAVSALVLAFLRPSERELI